MHKGFILSLVLSTGFTITTAQVRPVPAITKPSANTRQVRPLTDSAQPKIRTVKPNRSSALDPKTRVTKPRPITPASQLYTTALQKQAITLIAGDYIPVDPDVHEYFFSGSDLYIYSDLQKWEINFLWRQIPAGSTMARYEISELPFPLGIQNDFCGIVLSGIVERKNDADSFAFKLSYQNPNASNTISITDRQLPATRLRVVPDKSKPGYPRIQPLPIGATVFINGKNLLLNAKNKSVSRRQDIVDGNTTLHLSNLSILNTVNNLGKYYVRIIPLNADKQPVGNPSNVVMIKYENQTITPQPPPAALKLYDDYTITSFKYIQPHYAEAGFELCNIITGYNEELVSSSSLYKSIKDAFPVGTKLCPKKAEDYSNDSWYDKAFNGVAGTVTAVVNGASKVYSDTKGFVKDNMQDAVCGNNEGCRTAVGTGFEVAMAYAGLPPSLPNFEEMAQLAEGQLVDGAVAIAEEKSGISCPDAVREKMKQELHDKIVASSKKNMVDNGFMQFKPDPKGQYKDAYIEIEITRTGNSYQGKPLLLKPGCWHSASKIVADYSNILQQSYAVPLTVELFEHGTLILPYMPNIGDRTKLILVLKPKRLFIHRNKGDGKISRIDESDWDYSTEWHSVEYPVDQGQISPGFQTMFLNSNNSFSIGGLKLFKVAPGVQMSWQNHE